MEILNNKELEKLMLLLQDESAKNKDINESLNNVIYQLENNIITKDNKDKIKDLIGILTIFCNNKRNIIPFKMDDVDLYNKIIELDKQRTLVNRLMHIMYELYQRGVLQDKIYNFNDTLSMLVELQNKLNKYLSHTITKEETKQWLVLPFLSALGYDIFDRDVIPEYKIDIETNKSEQIDYLIQINSDIIIISCLRLNTQLSKEHVTQLYKYFKAIKADIAILTNGDDYWFFMDSKEDNIMDLKPYHKIRLSKASINDLSILEIHAKSSIEFVYSELKYNK